MDDKRFVAYAVTGTIALTPIIHATGPLDQVKFLPVLAPHEYHIEVSVSAQPLVVPVVAYAGSYWLTVEAAKIKVEGQGVDLN